MRGRGQRGEVGGHRGARVERAREQRVIDAVRRHERVRVDRALGVGERVVDREHRVDLREQRALGGDRLRAIEVAEHRPLVDAVVDRELLAERADVVGDVRQERPQLELADAEAQAQRADRRAQDLAVDRARDGAVRQRQHERRRDPQIVLDVDRPARELAQLARILPRSRPLAELRRARRDRVQPQHAARSGELAQHVMIRGRILVPVLGEGDDRRGHGRRTERTRRWCCRGNGVRRCRVCDRARLRDPAPRAPDRRRVRAAPRATIRCRRRRRGSTARASSWSPRAARRSASRSGIAAAAGDARDRRARASRASRSSRVHVAHAVDRDVRRQPRRGRLPRRADSRRGARHRSGVLRDHGGRDAPGVHAAS